MHRALEENRPLRDVVIDEGVAGPTARSTGSSWRSSSERRDVGSIQRATNTHRRCTTTRTERRPRRRTRRPPRRLTHEAASDRPRATRRSPGQPPQLQLDSRRRAGGRPIRDASSGCPRRCAASVRVRSCWRRFEQERSRTVADRQQRSDVRRDRPTRSEFGLIRRRRRTFDQSVGPYRHHEPAILFGLHGHRS